MATKYYWNPPTGREEEFVMGVPQENLQDEQFDSYKPWIQESIRVSGLWSSRNPNPTTRRARTVDTPDDAPDDAPAPVADAKET